MSTHLDPFKAAIIVAAAVMLAVIYSAFNGSVSKFGSHNFVLLHKNIDLRQQYFLPKTRRYTVNRAVNFDIEK